MSFCVEQVGTYSMSALIPVRVFTPKENHDGSFLGNPLPKIVEFLDFTLEVIVPAKPRSSHRHRLSLDSSGRFLMLLCTRCNPQSISMSSSNFKRFECP